MTEAYEGELEWLRSKARELDALQDEIEQLTGSKAALQAEIERLRELNDRLTAERHTTKRMLEDILDKHGVVR